MYTFTFGRLWFLSHATLVKDIAMGILVKSVDMQSVDTA